MALGDTSILDRLNAAERDVLRLLAQGHTAKSIASLRGITVAGVNERLRSARRKTDVGSSRELARLVTAEESRDDFIGLFSAPSVIPEDRRQAASQTRRAAPFRRWRLPMAASALLAIAIFAQQTSAPPTTPNRPVLPPAAQAIFAPAAPAPDVAALHAEVSAGATDPTWSARTEAALSQAYNRSTDVSRSVSSLDVTCNGSLCEVVGVARTGLSGAETDALMEAIQLPIALEIRKAQGLELVVQSINSTRDESARDRAGAVFVAYWRRAT